MANQNPRSVNRRSSDGLIAAGSFDMVGGGGGEGDHSVITMKQSGAGDGKNMTNAMVMKAPYVTEDRIENNDKNDSPRNQEDRLKDMDQPDFSLPILESIP